ncbi:MAG: hypothetical protein JXL97_11345 [Bacteroidales bacterium]|nr:hypothetical protein [Bacteroidales bacterium]
MDETSNNKTTNEAPILTTQVRPSIYLLFAATLGLILLVTLGLPGYLSVWGWIIVGVYSLALFAAVSTLKKIEIFSTGFEVKYLINGKKVFYQYEQISDLQFLDTKASGFKMKVLKLISVNKKEIVFSSFLYPKVIEMHEEIAKKVK